MDVNMEKDVTAAKKVELRRRILSFAAEISTELYML